ncbi:MAG: flippase-like domain-containing protein [Phycisphaerales bacterium]|nr:flippase-like domain-containing protein [Phycisphaerales bacterium]MCB9863115.1 flippase-like domain-containing protein [Phycisphaerales bacterium]
MSDHAVIPASGAGSADLNGERHRASHLRVFQAAVQIAIAIGLLAWLIRSGALRWPVLSRLFASPGFVAIAMLLVIGNYLFLTLRLMSIVRASGGRLAWATAMRFTITAAFAGWLIPGGLGSDMTKAYLLGHGFDGDVSRGIGVALLDRLLGLAALLVLAVCGQLATLDAMLRIPTLRSLFGVCVAATVGFSLLFSIGLVCSGRIGERMADDRCRRGGIAGVVFRVFAALAATARRPGLLGVGFVWSLCAQASVVGAAIVVCFGLTGAAPNATTCALVPVGLVANALPLSPGGLGVGEAVFDSLFAMAGTAGGAEIALSWRALAVVGSLPGLWFMIRWLRRRDEGMPSRSGTLPASGS